MPTTLELAGVNKPKHVEFHSLMPLLRGENVKPYDSIYGAYLSVQRMITKDGFKLILYPSISKARLYHVAADPREKNDLAGQEKYKPVIADLFANLLDLQKQTGDSLDLRQSFPNL